MLVYRICGKEEIDLIFNKGIKFAGRPMENTDDNTHNYQSNINYLHFFLIKVMFCI